jgi:hypothetical protein
MNSTIKSAVIGTPSPTGLRALFDQLAIFAASKRVATERHAPVAEIRTKAQIRNEELLAEYHALLERAERVKEQIRAEVAQ